MTTPDGWRRTLLGAIPFAVVAFIVGALLEEPSGQDDPLDRFAYPLLAFGMFLLELVLLLVPRSIHAVVTSIVVSASGFFLLKFVFLLFLQPHDTRIALEFTETFFWLPALYVLAFFVPGVPIARVAATTFFTSMFALSLAYLAINRTIVAPALLYALLQLNLANITLFLLSRALLTLKDVYARSEAKSETLEKLAYTDFLTQLPNRLQLERDLNEVLRQAQQNNDAVSVLYIDIDGFKLINDTLGHESGDEVLREVARRLRALTRDSDPIARISGDEFVIALPGVGTLDAELIAQRFLNTLTGPFMVLGQAVNVTASIGIASSPIHGQGTAELLRHADSAMYHVKNLGRNSVRAFQATLDAEVEERKLLARDLQGALERGELSLAYQPIVDLGTNQVVKVEALLRWTHPELGSISPARFIPLAESSGQIIPIGTWALREACRTARQWYDRGARTVMCVNVSPLQFAQATFVQSVTEALKLHGLPSRLLELELTEGIVMRNIGTASETLLALRRLGVSTAIDDFGTGYSSLAYLRDLPIDTLKIDRSFVQDLGAPRRAPQYALALMDAILTVARTLDLEVVAEGIETSSQLATVKDLGVHLAQGYLFAKPGPADRIQHVFSVTASPAPARPDQQPN